MVWAVRSIDNHSGLKHTFIMNPSQLEESLKL